jgi:hypothetical protein
MSFWVMQAPSGIPRDPQQLVEVVFEASNKLTAQQHVNGRPGATLKGGPFTSMADAKAFIAHDTGSKDTSITGQIGNATGPIPNLLSPFTGIAAVGAFFNKLSEANTWLRIGEAFLGVVLIAIALGKLTGMEDQVKEMAKNIKVVPV